MKEMHVLGMGLRDYSVKEAMRMVDGFLLEARANTISYLSMDMLLSAHENEKLRDWLSSMDLTVPVSPEILAAAGIGGRGRIKEVEEGKFHTELMKKLSEQERTAFLLSENEEILAAHEEYLKNTAPGIRVVGSLAAAGSMEDPDGIVNEINSAFPDIVFSRLPFPLQEQFICEHGEKLNARMFVSLKEGFGPEQHREDFMHRIRHFLSRTAFRQRVAKSETEKAKEEHW